VTNSRQVLAQAPVGIAVTDSGGMCTFVNERFGMLYGGPPGTLPGRSWLSVVDPADRARVC
jgi:PAS domain S-box-containing protein